MFAESLLESAPHPGHRSAWTKLASAMAQSLAVAALLAIPLFHLERIQFVAPPPSIQMTAVAQAPVAREVAQRRRCCPCPRLCSSIAYHRRLTDRERPVRKLSLRRQEPWPVLRLAAARERSPTSSQ